MSGWKWRSSRLLIKSQSETFARKWQTKLDPAVCSLLHFGNEWVGKSSLCGSALLSNSSFPMFYLGIILFLASTVSAIIVLIKLFQAKGALHGILGLFCGIYTFIWGWINAKSLNLMKPMLIWTLGLPIGYGLMLPKIISDASAQIQEVQKQIEASQAAQPAPQQ